MSRSRAAKLGLDEKLAVIRARDQHARKMKSTATGPWVDALIAEECPHSHDYGGRGVFGWELPAQGHVDESLA